MGKARVREGRRYQGDTPAWGPLLDAVGERVTGDFMWMVEVVLDDGTPLQAYKHVDTRRYVHLAPDGTAFFYEEPDRYRSIATARVLAEVFAPLPGLFGVTDEQISASWAAVEHLRRVRTPSDVQRRVYAHQSRAIGSWASLSCGAACIGSDLAGSRRGRA